MSTHPPVADRVICVDFDGTIRPWGGLFADVEPFDGVREAMEALRLAGYRIVIFTSRLSFRWWGADYRAHRYPSAMAFGEANIAYLREYLARHGIAFDEMLAQKIPAERYFDDKAVYVEPGELAIRIWDFLR